MDLAGRTILVTGAGGVGVGGGVCRAVKQAGGVLVVNELRQYDADRAADEHGAAAAYAADVSSAEQVEAMFARIAADFGAIDGVVNNAGVGLSVPAHEATVADYDRLNGADQRGVWLVSKGFARLVADRGSGSIVNISSVHARATISRYALYAAAKAAVEGLTRGLAVELGRFGIRCNAVAPGYVHSEQNEELIRTWTDDPDGWVSLHTANQQALPRTIEAVDCGWSAVFLLSDKSRCVTGQVLAVDAGTTALLYNRDFV